MVISMPGTLTKMLLNGAKYAPVPRTNETSGEVEWDINSMALGDEGSYWGRRAPFPGSSVVQKWDTDAGYPLVQCSDDDGLNCPLADENGVNFAPFFAEGGEAYALNGRQSKPAARRVMWDLFTWLSELPVTELPLSGQYRKSHLDEDHRKDLTEGAGWPKQMVDDIFALLDEYFKSEEEGGNPVQDLLMLGFPEYMNALDEELHDKFLGVALDSTVGLFNRDDPMQSVDPQRDQDSYDQAFTHFIDSLETRYNAISDSISGGRIGQLQRWRNSLNLPWRTDEEICVAVLSSKPVAFRNLQCASIVSFESLCQTQPEAVAKFDEALCATMSDSTSDSVNLAILIPSIVIPLVLLAIVIGYYHGERQKQSGDLFWSIKQQELNYSEPATVIGRGAFGVVLLAEYRGTQVAVKRVLQEKAVAGNKSLTHSTMSKMSGEDGGNMMSVGAQSMLKVSSDDLENGKSKGLKSMALLKSKAFPQSSSYESRKAEFIQEMRQLARLRHPCICTVMGAVVDSGVEPMLVMEYCEHGSLYDILQNHSVQLDGDVLLPILRDVCQGVRFLHASDPAICHGDIKSHNILVDSRFRAKVADFGLSSSKQSRGATGSPLWMAPELLRAESGNTEASDAYSFGIVLYEVYSRQDPYEGEDLKTVIAQVNDPKVNKRPPVPTTCPLSIASTMKECLDADPQSRPTFEEIDLRLKRLGADKVTPQESPYAAYGRKKQEGQDERLLHNVFPPHIAKALREGRKVENEHHECVTIYFSDIVGFTTMSETLGPEKVADLLDRLYTRFDDLTTQHEIYKCETIGDAYMAITNLVKDQQTDHVKRMAQFSMDCLKASEETLIDTEDPSKGTVRIRVGFHSGPVLSGVVGTRLPKYGVFGDTVNTASRMESHSIAMGIHCSEASAELLLQQAPEIPLEARGQIEIKGKDKMSTYWVG